MTATLSWFAAQRTPALARALQGDRGHPALRPVGRRVGREEAVARLTPGALLGKARATRDEHHRGERRDPSEPPCSLRSFLKAGRLGFVAEEAVREELGL